MDKLTHLNALRAAARVAFGVVVLGGCSAAATEDETASSESSINAEDPCPSKTDAAAPKPDAKPSCESVLASAWPDGGNDFMASQNPTPVSDEVKACCEAHLTDTTKPSWEQEYRWSCCGVLDSWNNPNDDIRIACTPWGPPVPPAMKMRAVA